MRHFTTIAKPLVLMPYAEAHIHYAALSNDLLQYVGVLYDGGLTTSFDYGECYPYEIDGNLAQMAVFCKSVTCESNPYVTLLWMVQQIMTRCSMIGTPTVQEELSHLFLSPYLTVQL